MTGKFQFRAQLLIISYHSTIKSNGKERIIGFMIDIESVMVDRDIAVNCRGMSSSGRIKFTHETTSLFVDSKLVHLVGRSPITGWTFRLSQVSLRECLSQIEKRNEPIFVIVRKSALFDVARNDGHLENPTA